MKALDTLNRRQLLGLHVRRRHRHPAADLVRQTPPRKTPAGNPRRPSTTASAWRPAARSTCMRAASRTRWRPSSWSTARPSLTDNKPGAGGLIALQQLQRNRGNAHYLGTFHTGSLAGQVTGILKADMREFVPVAMLVEETTLVAVRADSPLKTAQGPGRCAQARPHVRQDRRGAAQAG